jgi:hypothetical protein
VAFDYNSFFIHANGFNQPTNLTWGSIGRCVGGGVIGDCNGGTQNVVRYDSPTYAGFSVSASWGQDDMWDVAARYAGEHGGFKVAAAAAYSENSTDAQVAAFGWNPTDTQKYFQVGAYIEHVATGVFAYGAYGHEEMDIATGESQTYYAKAGLRERWNPLGHTVLYGEYEHNRSTDNFTVLSTGFSNVPNAALGPNGSEGDFNLWGGGIVQEIDAAAMSIWLSYRHLDYSNGGGGLGPLNFDDFQYVKFGALINC